ncbi:MAG TPA: DUF6151 family protein [Hyphomicrobiaceae bacterium]|jgi:hypothetical protein
MGNTATLACSCREVRGLVTDVAPDTVNRVVCYCEDCQAFLHKLDRADLLDGQGGTDIVQLAPASLSFVQGKERIVGLRLTSKGIYRWYASCCSMPLGNTLSPAIPFIGVVAQAFERETQKPDQLFGPPIGRIFGKHAVGRPPEGSIGFNPWLMARAIRRVLGWRLRGKAWPHPFFDRASRQPSFPLSTLSSQEREALRPLCGPNPSLHRQ